MRVHHRTGRGAVASTALRLVVLGCSKRLFGPSDGPSAYPNYPRLSPTKAHECAAIKRRPFHHATSPLTPEEVTGSNPVSSNR